VGVLVNSLAQVPYAQIQAFGRPDLTAKFHLIELPLQVALVWALVTTWGIAGAALAWSIRITVDAVFLFGAAAWLAALPGRSLATHRVPHTLLVLGIFAGSVVLVSSSLASSPARLPLIGALWLLETVAAWRYALDDQDRARIRHLLRPTQGR